MIADSQVISYFKLYTILPEAQFRFRKDHSNTSCFLNLFKYIFLNVDRGHLMGVILLDLNKPFNMVDHI